MARHVIGIMTAHLILLMGPARGVLAEPPGATALSPMPVPRIGGGIAPPTAAKLEAGFSLAVERLRTVPACGALFSELGADGIDALSNTYYVPADVKSELRICRRAHGFTIVKGAPTWLCQNFARLQDHRAAAVLLHEGLHHAGLNEWPHDPDGPRPRAIDKMVEDACDL
jgi:hypothetical protein